MSQLFDRRRLLTTAASLLAAPAIMTRPARAAEFEFKMSTTILPDHPLNARAKEAAEAVLKESGGRLQINVFPGYQLGNNASILTQLRSGGIEFATFSGGILSTLVPVATIYNTAFAFATNDQVFEALDGKLGDYLRAQIEKSGLHALGKLWELGFRQVTTSTRPVNAPADLRGMKLRVPVAPLFVSAFNALGAAPAPINFDELYTALQTKIVDGEENDLFQIEAGRLFEVQKYCSMTNHIWDGYYSLVNGRVWRSLPDDLKEIWTKHFDAAVGRERDDMRQKNASVRKSLEGKGIVFNETDTAAFRDSLKKAGFYAEWKTKFGPEAWSQLEAIAGSLT